MAAHPDATPGCHGRVGIQPHNAQTWQGPAWGTGSEQGLVILLLQAPQTDSCFAFSDSLSYSHSLQKARPVCSSPAAASALAAPAAVGIREVLPLGISLAHPLPSPRCWIPQSCFCPSSSLPVALTTHSSRTGCPAPCSRAAPSQDTTALLLP